MLKGRKFLFILFLGGLSLLLLLSVSIPITFTNRTTVPLNLSRTMEQFTLPEQLNKWVIPGIKSGDDSVRLIRAVPGTVVLAFTVDGEDRQYDFHISKDKTRKKTSVVSMPIATTLWKRYIDPHRVDKLVIDCVHNLGAFANDTKKLYGYKINEGKPVDSSFLFLTTLVQDSSRFRAASRLFDSLIQFANHRFMRYNGNRYFSTQLRDSGKVMITASIGIEGKPLLKSSDGINKKTVEPGHPQLELEYHGPYKGIDQVYKALEQYKRDNAIIGSDLAMEAILNPGYGFTPDDDVIIKLCAPYYSNQ